ncbi:MAG: hypothetical protein M1831_002721 [Alyxoria varia]|nr:MAG: hypothetical protein M1831_002721 [Alyxoria varia]
MPPTSHQMSPQAFSTPSHPIPPPAFEEHWQHHPSHPAWSYPQSTPGFPPRHESNGPPRVHPIAGSWRKPSRTSKSNSLPGIEARDRNSVNEDGSLKLNAGNLKELQGSMAPAKPSAASSPGSSAMKIESEFPSPEEPDHEKNSAPTTTYPNYLNASKLATADASRSNSMKDAEPSAPTEAKANAHQTTTSASSMASKVQEASVSDPSAISRPTPWRPDQSQASSSRYTPDATSQRQVPPASTSVKPSVEADESVASDDSYSPPPVFVKAPMTRHSADAAPVLKRVPSHFGYNSCPRGIDGFQMIPPPPPPMQPPPPPPDSPPGDIDTNDRPRTPNWGILDKQLRGTPPVSSIEEDASQDGEVEGVAKASKQSAFDLSHDGASAQPTQSSIDRSPKVESEYALKRSAKSKQRSSPKANTPKSESGGARKRKREDPNWEKKMRTRSARRYIL